MPIVKPSSGLDRSPLDLYACCYQPLGFKYASWAIQLFPRPVRRVPATGWSREDLRSGPSPFDAPLASRSQTADVVHFYGLFVSLQSTLICLASFLEESGFHSTVQTPKDVAGRIRSLKNTSYN